MTRRNAEVPSGGMWTIDTMLEKDPPSVRLLLQLSVPAIIFGAVCAIGLFLVDKAAHYVQEFLWVYLP